MQLLIRVVGAAAVLSLAGAGAKALPPVEAFGSLPLAQPQLSPDGKHFAVIQEIGGRPAAAIYTVNTKNPPKLIGDSRDVVIGIRWAKNDRLLITLVTNAKIGGDTKIRPYYQTLAVDPAGEHEAVMFSGSIWAGFNNSTASLEDLDIEDPTHIFMNLLVPKDFTFQDRGFIPEIYKVDVTTGKAEPVMKGDKRHTQWIMDGHGRVAGRVDGIEKPLREHLLNFSGGTWNQISDLDADDGRSTNMAGLDEKGTSYIRFIKGDPTWNLVLVDRTSGKETPLYSNPKYDAGDALTDVWTGRVIGVSFDDDRNQYFYFDPAMEALQRGLEAAFPDRSVHAVSWDTTKDKLIIAVEGPQSPMTYYFLDRTTHQAMKIASSYGAVSESDLGERKPYPYKARDGLDIPAYLTLPPGKTAKNLPSVILPHGGPLARDDQSFDWMAAFFAGRGYAVLQPNFRGSFGYGIKFEEAGYGQWGLKMQDDITDGMKKLIADGIADPKRICIVGASYGGYAALAGAAFTPGLYACAASYAGVSDIRHLAATQINDSQSQPWLISAWSHYIGDRYDDADKLDAASPALHADQIACPVLLMHAVGDSTVRIEQSEEMRDALQAKGKTVEFVKFDNDSHYMRLADTRIRFLTETEAFLKKNIGN